MRSFCRVHWTSLYLYRWAGWNFSASICCRTGVEIPHPVQTAERVWFPTTPSETPVLCFLGGLGFQRTRINWVSLQPGWKQWFGQVRNCLERNSTADSVKTFLSITAQAVAPCPCSHPPVSHLAATSSLLCGHPGWSPRGVTLGFTSLPHYSNCSIHLIRHFTFTPAWALLRAAQERRGKARQPFSPGAVGGQPFWRCCCAKTF